jgi:3'-5' exoribonuclease 1
MRLAPYDYLCICDLEATCDNEVISKEEHEIIEFPYVVFELKTRQIVTQQQYYVSPENTKVTPFCSNLTGITQEKLDSVGEKLQVVVTRIEDELSTITSLDNICLLWDGDWDVTLVRDKSVF